MNSERPGSANDQDASCFSAHIIKPASLSQLEDSIDRLRKNMASLHTPTA
jgi:hypothetical protein